jgi:hypothetical protein
MILECEKEPAASLERRRLAARQRRHEACASARPIRRRRRDAAAPKGAPPPALFTEIFTISFIADTIFRLSWLRCSARFALIESRESEHFLH